MYSSISDEDPVALSEHFRALKQPPMKHFRALKCSCGGGFRALNAPIGTNWTIFLKILKYSNLKTSNGGGCFRALKYSNRVFTLRTLKCSNRVCFRALKCSNLFCFRVIKVWIIPTNVERNFSLVSQVRICQSKYQNLQSVSLPSSNKRKIFRIQHFWR